MRTGRVLAVAIAASACAWAASCTFKPVLGYEPCGAGDSCPAGYQCLGSEQVCIPSCEPLPPCAEPDAGPPDAGPQLSVSPEVLPPAIELRPYRVELVADGGVGPYSFREPALAPLPPGLQLDAGVLSGTLENAGVYQVRVQVEDSSSPPASATADRSLEVRPLLRLAGPVTLANAAAGQAYSETLSATGGRGGYRFRLTSAGLPDGLVLTDGGTITGSTGDSGSASFDVEVVDGDDPAQVAVRRVSLEVIALPLALQIATRSLPDGRVGTPYSYRLQRLAGSGPFTWTLAAGLLPRDVGLDPDGLISGVPSERGRSSFTIKLEDSLLGSDQATFTIDVL